MSRKKKAKTGNATVTIINKKTIDASDGNGSDENCDAIQRTSEISTNVQEKEKVAIRPRPTARSTRRKEWELQIKQQQRALRYKES